MKRIASFPEKKQVVFLFLLLSLLLSACAAAPELETTPYSLPALREPSVSADPEWVPILTPHTVSNPQISGPLGQVNALRYREGSCLDPVYGDVDGDGQTELVYRSPSADRGTVYEGVWIYGTAADGASDLYRTDLTGPAAIVIGNEGEGMSRLVRESCDLLVSIPMKGRISSLNASAAATVLLYEAMRQRGIHNS